MLVKQVTQKLKSGNITIEEVPVPALPAGMVLVRNHYSLISAGTEGSTAKTARKGERDYGPDSERKMDTMTALRILIGHWSHLTVRECADQHGLSRGQINY